MSIELSVKNVTHFLIWQVLLRCIRENKEYKHSVKIIILIMLLVSSSGAVGTSIAAHINMHMKMKPSENVQLAVAGYQRHRVSTAPTTPSYATEPPDVMDASILATHSAQITNSEEAIATNATAIVTLNQKLNDAALKNALDNERLGARIDNDETKLTTAIAVVGSIMSVGMAILLFFHFDERFKRRQHKEAEGS
jgi:flagellar basal body-associated protein FliL